MAVSPAQQQQLKDFFLSSDFAQKGWVITDLDGTVIHEFQGHYLIPDSVKRGLASVYALGRPVVLNTLRFPLSVLRTFGHDWYGLSNGPVPTILMNGSQLGYMTKIENGQFSYEEIAAFPLLAAEIESIIDTINRILAANLDQLLVFYYPRDWKKGELLWATDIVREQAARDKYASASLVFSGPVAQLAESLRAEEICMVFLLVDVPQDKLMAYQHTQQHNFFTRQGVDKLSGAVQMAKYLHLQLDHSLGAGDTPMDVFLQGVGLAVHVRDMNLPFASPGSPIKVAGSEEFGELLFELADLQKSAK